MGSLSEEKESFTARFNLEWFGVLGRKAQPWQPPTATPGFDSVFSPNNKWAKMLPVLPGGGGGAPPLSSLPPRRQRDKTEEGDGGGRVDLGPPLPPVNPDAPFELAPSRAALYFGTSASSSPRSTPLHSKDIPDQPPVPADELNGLSHELSPAQPPPPPLQVLDAAQEFAHPPYFTNQPRVLGPNLSDEVRAVIAAYGRRSSATSYVRARVDALTELGNFDYGIVPIKNTFTKPSQGEDGKHVAVTGGGGVALVDRFRLDLEVDAQPYRKQSGKARDPPGPAVPTAQELARTQCKILLIEVSFMSGRRALFQTKSKAKSDVPIADLVDKIVVLGQDDGVDLAKLVAWEELHKGLEAVAHIPEASYMPVLREAFGSEIKKQAARKVEEEACLQLARKLLLETKPRLAMEIAHCEIQFDRNKVIMYCDCKGEVQFTAFVNSFSKALTGVMGEGTHPRVFFQCRFAVRGEKAWVNAKSRVGRSIRTTSSSSKAV